MKTAQCAPLKHHYDECAERVQQQEEEHGKAQEDCVEECKSILPSITSSSFAIAKAFNGGIVTD